MSIDMDKIKEVIRLMEEHSLQEIEIENEGTKIRLKKSGGDIVQYVTPPSYSPENFSSHAVSEEKVQQQEKGNFIEIKAPMVGTFYRAPSPGAEPFVDRGTVVKPGDTLCIVEAMKLMNEIKSEVSGRIVDILVENAEPVEFGQVLFLVEPM